MNLVDHPPTPKLTHHARERCAQMGVLTARVKRIAREPHLRRPSSTGGQIVTRDDDPTIAVIVADEDLLRVITVVWRSYEPYVRDGAGGYTLIDEESA